MKTGPLKTTIWYKCLVCHTCFQFPKALVVHRMKSQCRFKYKEIHKERSKWPLEIPSLENLDQEEVSRLKDSQQLLKSQKATALEPTEQYSNKSKINVPELTKTKKNLDLTQVASCNINLPRRPRNQEQLKYNCYFCSSLFTNFEDLKNHMMDHTREESDEPKSEGFNFDNRKNDNELKLHKISTLGKYICNLCQKSCCSNQALNLHISSIHEKRILNSCKQCSKNFSTISHLKTHISAVHEKLKPYSCKECPKRFGQSSTLHRHVFLVHKRLKPYSCKQCPKTFNQSTHLRTHISIVHKQLISLHSCKQCPKTFNTKHCLKRHFSMVHEKLRLNCKQCSKTFSTKQWLKSHISAVHLGLKPYSCKQCPKKFGQSTNLKSHIARVHEKLKLYSCKQCQKSFSALHNLKYHISHVHKLVNIA